jgi:dihydroflavonol-4-reductase
LKPVLVTGATGFLGWHVARELTERGFRVRALARDPGKIRELDVEAVTGDLRNPESLERAVDGCSVVYHVAADYRLWAKDSSELYRSNVDGTRNLLAASQAAGVERFVYTSTVGCIGVPDGASGDESHTARMEEMKGAYKRSKLLAEQTALEYAAQGFPVVVVNPTAPIGDHDWKPTPTGQMVVDFLRGAMPAYVDTGLNVVDARDTAVGHVLACERGKPGERYILGSENLTLRQIFEKLEAVSGIKAPQTRIPYALAFAAGVISTGWAYVGGSPPRAPLDGVRMSRKKMWVSNRKAVEQLGFQPAAADVALRRAAAWFRDNGYCG